MTCGRPAGLPQTTCWLPWGGGWMRQSPWYLIATGQRFRHQQQVGPSQPFSPGWTGSVLDATPPQGHARLSFCMLCHRWCHL